MWLVGFELRTFGKAVSALNCEPSLQPKLEDSITAMEVLKAGRVLSPTQLSSALQAQKILLGFKSLQVG